MKMFLIACALALTVLIACALAVTVLGGAIAVSAVTSTPVAACSTCG